MDTPSEQAVHTDITEVVRIIFARATSAHASDVHIEPTGKAVRIRFRVDGVLADQGVLPLTDLEQIMIRLKVLANLDIAITPIPQDGHFELDVSEFGTVTIHPSSGQEEKILPAEKNLLDVRISVFPTINGEAAVCRLLNRAESVFSIEQLGLSISDLARTRALFNRNYGMVLVTGPTGSGKTTTLYSILQELMHDDKNVVTLEDPVEFRFEKIRQTQIHPERGLTFASGMKSILRQDPDVIMIGEIRDQETGEHAVRASLIGRVVLSTIHSNTTVGTIARLIDMNIERSLIAYAISGVIAARLVRKNCSSCLEEYTPDPSYLKLLEISPDEKRFFRGKGCALCGNTGLRGRSGIFEILEFDDTLRGLIIDHASMIDLEAAVAKSGHKTLKQDAMEKIFDGTFMIESVVHSV